MDVSRLRILMIEDDPLNRTLANHLFKKLGCAYKLTEIDSVLKGEEQSDGYDLIFLDIETTEGYTILEKIHHHDITVPVVGMTIDSNNILLLKCRAAGMDDYILKPLKFDVLSEKINTVIARSGRSATLHHTPLFDFDKFYVTCGSNKATAKNIIALYLAHTSDNLKQLENYLHDRDWDNLKSLIHRIKVVYSLMGLPEVKNYFDQIETDINKNTIDIDKFTALLTTITERSVQLMEELAEIKI